MPIVVTTVVAIAIATAIVVAAAIASGKHLLPTLERRHCLNLWLPFCFVWGKHFASQVHLFLNALRGLEARRESFYISECVSGNLNTLGHAKVSVNPCEGLPFRWRVLPNSTPFTSGHNHNIRQQLTPKGTERKWGFKTL